MKNLFAVANQYVAQSDWKTLALVKLCLFAMGILVGIQVAPKHKKTAAGWAVPVFLATYVPLMAKFWKLTLDAPKEG